MITDLGPGIPGTPEQIAALYSFDRDLLSGKFWRRPTRGALGNGNRVAAAAATICNGEVIVETHGQTVHLKPMRDGTEIIATGASDVTIGTAVTLSMPGCALPYDVEALSWAHAAIRLAQCAATPYSRQPNPHWLDADYLSEIVACIEPADTTIRALIERFDGLTGARAGKIATALFGKGRTCRSLSDDDVVLLLNEMQQAARAVKPDALGPCGPDVYPERNYVRIGGEFTYGAREPQASIPFIVECWCRVTDRKGKRVTVDGCFVNRAVPSDSPRLFRLSDQPKRILIDGSGLADLFDTIELPLGDCQIALAITSPLVPIITHGKSPNYSFCADSILEAVRKAFIRARNSIAPNPSRSRVSRAVVNGDVLGDIIADAAEIEGVNRTSLYVLDRKYDPYAQSTEKGHVIGKWFAEQHIRALVGRPSLHLRGLHYVISSTNNIYRADNGELYVNSEENWVWLQSVAAKAARWLGYVDFDLIEDERNAEPLWYAADFPDDHEAKPAITIAEGVSCSVPDIDELLPSIEIDTGRLPMQPYRLAIIGEKSSLHHVVEPIARELHIDVVLDSGTQSDTHLHRLAKRASLDPRPCVVFFLSDFDPTGNKMPSGAARKFQALRDLLFPNLNLRLYPVALTYEQCIEYKLPSTPIKQSDPGATEWKGRWGREQTEIDALLALHTGALEAILRAAIDPFFDPTLADRIAKAQAEQTRSAREWLKAQSEYREARKEIAELRRDAEDAIERLNAGIAYHAEAVQEKLAFDADAPKPAAIEVEPETPGEADVEPLFDTADDFVTATRKLQAHNRRRVISKQDLDDDSDNSDDAEGGAG